MNQAMVNWKHKGYSYHVLGAFCIFLYYLPYFILGQDAVFRISDFLDERGWTQTELAKRTGFTKKHINLLIIGRHGAGDIVNQTSLLTCQAVEGTANAHTFSSKATNNSI